MTNDEKQEYFWDEMTINLPKTKEFLAWLDELEANNNFLPTPHLIQKYLDYISWAIRETDQPELYDIEDRLIGHYTSAYEQ